MAAYKAPTTQLGTVVVQAPSTTKDPTTTTTRAGPAQAPAPSPPPGSPSNLRLALQRFFPDLDGPSLLHFSLNLAAMLFAIATLTAQAIMMRHAEPVTIAETPETAETTDTPFFPSVVFVKGEDVAKWPAVVLVAGVTATVRPAVLFYNLSLSFPRAHRVWWVAAVDVALVGFTIFMWVLALGASAKTAGVLKGSGWPRKWVGGNTAALVFEGLSLGVWSGIFVLSVRVLVAMLRKREGHQEAAGGGAGNYADQQPWGTRNAYGA